MVRELDDVIGHPFNFYGVDNCRFKLGRYVFEAIEDEADGHRSLLQEVPLVEKKPDDVFRQRPFTTVKVEKYDDAYCDGYRLVDVNDGHVWLYLGTDNWEDYYPMFVFRYEPKKAS